MQAIYRHLCTTGEVRLYINKWVELSFCLSISVYRWVELSFCLPQKLHKKHFPNILVEPECIYECLEALRPYHCLLLLVEAQDLLEGGLSVYTRSHYITLHTRNAYYSVQSTRCTLQCTKTGLSTDASPALRRLVRQSSPLRSLRGLAVDTDLSIMQVGQMVHFLLNLPSILT